MSDLGPYYTELYGLISELGSISTYREIVQKIQKLIQNDRDERKKKHAEVVDKFRRDTDCCASPGDSFCETFGCGSLVKIRDIILGTQEPDDYDDIPLRQPKEDHAICDVCDREFPLKDMKHIPGIGSMCKDRFSCKPTD